MANSSDNDYEVFPAVGTLNLSLGIRCMEVNVQEVDDAVRQFSQQAADITSPSWKFPHVTLEELDVQHVMSAFRAHATLTEDQLYMELMELLIDRLYYAIMTSFEFVNGLEALFVNCGLGKDEGYKTDWDPLEIARKSADDNTPRPFHTANIGMLVRQFCLKMRGLENILLNNVHSMKTPLHVAYTCGTGRMEQLDNRFKDYFPLRHCEVQTEKILEDSCDSCYIAQNILKFVAEQIHCILISFNETKESKISKTRLELRKDALSITQRGALLRWVQALKEDCGNITSCANILLDFNVKAQDDMRALKEVLEIKEEDYEKKVMSQQENMDLLQEQLKAEQEASTKVTNERDAILAKCAEMEKMLHLKVRECEKLSQERDSLQRSLNISEELNLQIKKNMDRSSTDITKLKNDFQETFEYKEKFRLQVRTLSEKLAKAGQDILRLNENSVKVESLEEENTAIKNEVKRLKRINTKLEIRANDSEASVGDKDSKMKQLEGELSQMRTNLEVLTLYPDLNGPVAASRPSSANSGSSCVEAMEMQVKSNKIRIDVLKSQNERLTTTVNKLKAHLESNKNRPDTYSLYKSY